MVAVALASSCGRTSHSDTTGPSAPSGEAGTPAPTTVTPPREPVAGASGGAPATGGGGPTSLPRGGAGGGLTIEPSALVGCRAPGEPGCASCCVQDAEGCETLTSEHDWATRFPNVTPWYNITGYLAGACPTDCAVCASCTKKSEQQLRELGERACACERFAPGAGTGGVGVDPCGDETSCECYCQEHGDLSAACPAASPAPFAPKCEQPLEFKSDCSFQATCEQLGCADGLSPFGDDGCRHFCKDSSECGDSQRCRFTSIVNLCGGGGSEIEGCSVDSDGSCQCGVSENCTAPDVCVDVDRYPPSLDCDTSQATCDDLDERATRLDEAYLPDASAEKLQAIAACRGAIHARSLKLGCPAPP